MLFPTELYSRSLAHDRPPTPQPKKEGNPAQVIPHPCFNFSDFTGYAPPDDIVIVMKGFWVLPLGLRSWVYGVLWYLLRVPVRPHGPAAIEVRVPSAPTLPKACRRVRRNHHRLRMQPSQMLGTLTFGSLLEAFCQAIREEPGNWSTDLALTRQKRLECRLRSRRTRQRAQPV